MYCALDVGAGRCRLRGVVVTRFDDGGDAGFQAGRIESGSRSAPFVAHHVPLLRPGVEVDLDGYWQQHAEHGRQYRVVKALSFGLPRSAAGVERLLRDVPGFGPATAKRVVSLRGSGVLEELMADPAMLTRLVPDKRGRTLQLGWDRWLNEWRGLKSSMEFTAALAGFGCIPSQARRIVDFFRSAATAKAVLLRHPYRLLEVPGIGWKKVEEIGRALEVAPTDAERLIAAAVLAASRLQQRGHSGVTRQTLASSVGALLKDSSLANNAIDRALDAGELVEDGLLLYLPDDLEAEWSVASRLRRVARRRGRWEPSTMAGIEAKLNHSGLNDRQRQAVVSALTEGVTILTGGPGTGKTTTTAEIVRAAQGLGISVAIIAPTGRAAMRSAEVTGAPASTIHKALGGPPGSRREAPLRDGLIIIEECSMASIKTMAWLLENISSGTRIVLVGDADQLPSVEHGAVLRDLLRSGVLPWVQLASVYRQGEESGIVVSARKILRGAGIDGAEGDGFYFVDTTAHGPKTSPSDFAVQRLQAAVAWLEEQGGTSDLQVLTPAKQGPLGTKALNRMLQDLLNPGGTIGPRIGGGMSVRAGDRVIQIRNDYALGASGIMNGQQGTVAEVGTRRVRVAFAGEDVWIDDFRLYNLHLAWAITVHKSQGSEWPNVVVLADCSHGALLSRQLVYTALTRAKRNAVLISSQEALALVSRQDQSEECTTGLVHHLKVPHG